MSGESRTQTATAEQVAGEAVDERVVRELAEWARAEGLQMIGEGGLLSRLTKRVFEAALEGELDDHLGYGKHEPVGRDGGNSRNGRRAKTVLTEVGPVEVEVPRDRDGSFAPQLVKKRQRRLTGVDDLVISLSAKGLTHGEIAGHLAEDGQEAKAGAPKGDGKPEQVWAVPSPLVSDNRPDTGPGGPARKGADMAR